MPIVGRAKTDFLLLCIMKNGRQIRTQLTEKRLKLDSSSLYYEIAPTGPVPAPAVSSSSHFSVIKVERSRSSISLLDSILGRIGWNIDGNLTVTRAPNHQHHQQAARTGAPRDSTYSPPRVPGFPRFGCCTLLALHRRRSTTVRPLRVSYCTRRRTSL